MAATFVPISCQPDGFRIYLVWRVYLHVRVIVSGIDIRIDY